MKKNYVEDFKRKLEDEYSKIKQDVQKPNILVVGGTGVGKGSLINMVFGKNIAKIGVGKPVTQEIECHEDGQIDVRLYDSRGYETESSDDDKFLQNVTSFVKAETDPLKTIHLIWYCISAAGGRVTDYDLNAIKTFLNLNLPIAVVFTETDRSTNEKIAEMKSVIDIPDIKIFETTIMPQQYNQVQELVKWSVEKLPDSLRHSFIKSQRANLELKNEEANKYIKQHCVVAFGVGFTPRPFSDAPLLVSNEMYLIARLFHLYDLDSISDIISMTGVSIIIEKLASYYGKSATYKLIELFPKAGSVAKGLIDGGVGAIMTAAIGKAVSIIASEICRANLSGEFEQVKEMVIKFAPLCQEYAKMYVQSGKKEDDIINDKRLCRKISNVTSL